MSQFLYISFGSVKFLNEEKEHPNMSSSELSDWASEDDSPTLQRPIFKSKADGKPNEAYWPISSTYK
jgi:hypothetical protein